ncbi:hypothetical protein, partial [Marinobacter oulmenensis]
MLYHVKVLSALHDSVPVRFGHLQEKIMRVGRTIYVADLRSFSSAVDTKRRTPILLPTPLTIKATKPDANSDRFGAHPVTGLSCQARHQSPWHTATQKTKAFAINEAVEKPTSESSLPPLCSFIHPASNPLGRRH